MSDVINVAEIFGEDVFNDTVMQSRLPKKVYKDLKRMIQEGQELDLATADVMRLLSHQAVFVLHLRQEDIQHGIVHHLRL